MSTMTPERQAWLDGLRAMADWFEQNPERMSDLALGGGGIIVNLYPGGKKELAQLARKLGRVEKMQSGNLFYVSRKFGPHSIDGVTMRDQVCRRIVTGTREIPEEIIPAHDEDIVEWVCDEPLLAAVKS